MANQLHQTDVLVIGGGGAGCIAAIGASNYDIDVMIVTKDRFGYGSATRISGGELSAAFGQTNPTDDPDKHFKDTIDGGEHLNNQTLVQILVRDGQRAMIQLERYGVIFDRVKSQPDRYLSPQRLGGHRYPRTLECGFARGAELIHAVTDEVIRRGIYVVDEVMVTRLLTYNGTVVGATGIGMDGDFYEFRAKSTILCNGGCGQLFAPHTTNSRSLTGDGYALAYRAGAELMDMEMVQFVPYALTHPETAQGIAVGDPGFFGPGARLLNALGERFMLRYDPEFKEMSTRAKVSYAIAREVHEGHGTKYGGCLLDLTEAKKQTPEIFELFKSKIGNLILLYERVKEYYGEAAAEWEEPWDVYPIQHYIMGGVKITGKCETNINGLYAAGEVTGGIHGANRLGANSLTDIFVFGARAGQTATKRALDKGSPQVDKKQVEWEHKRVYDILERKSVDGIRAPALIKRLRKVAWDLIGVYRNTKGLECALTEIKNMKDQLPKIYLTSNSSRYNYEWIEALELPNMLDCAEIIARSALMRTESRGAHFRSDFPNRDDKNWLVNIGIKLEAGGMELSKTPVPLVRLRPSGV